MPLLDQIRETTLIELAQQRFATDLTDAELKVLRDSASSADLPEPDEKAPRPEVRADFLRWLATDSEAVPFIDPKGLRVFAATIPGKLDLRECHVNPTLDFHRCEFLGEINLLSAETRGIFLLDSSFDGGIWADRIDIQGPLYLKGSSFSGQIRLSGAQIKDELVCSGAKLKAKGKALNIDRAKISGSVFLNNGFESEGEIRMLSARIEGSLECSGAKLKARGNALSADGAKIGGNVFLNNGFESEGEIRLNGAEITGQLICSGAKLKAKGDALNADSMKIGNSVFLTDDFESDGAILLHVSEIGGNLLFQGAKVASVICQNAVVTGDLFWQRIEKSDKTILNLIGARVKNLRDDKKSWPQEGNLDLDGLVYEELSLHPSSSDENTKNRTYPPELPLIAKERIAWLMLQPEERRTEPQPWMQLRDLLERKGERKQAKYVLRRFRCLQAQKSWIP
jgi:sRNA-binding regulator protein Hfq